MSCCWWSWCCRWCRCCSCGNMNMDDT